MKRLNVFLLTAGIVAASLLAFAAPYKSLQEINEDFTTKAKAIKAPAEGNAQAYMMNARINVMIDKAEAISTYVKDNPKAADVWQAKMAYAQTLDQLETYYFTRAKIEKLDRNGETWEGDKLSNKRSEWKKSVEATYNEIATKAPAKSLERRMAVGREWSASPVGKPILAFEAKDAINGKTLTPASFKGKVLVLDFWATWCGPCIRELPNVQEAYRKYHDKGLEILSISLDRSQDEEKYKQFIKDKEMSWHHIFDGGYWQAELAQVYNIHSIPAMYVIGKDGKVFAANARGEKLHEAIEAALNAK